MNKITVKNLKLNACHGVHDFEKVQMQRFVISADLYLDFYEAAKEDDVSKTVSYSDACRVLSDVVTGNVFNLIEKLAYECAYALMENFPAVNKVCVRVEKPEAPVKFNVETVSVCAEVKRERAYLSLGSSMGDRQAYLDFALRELDKTRGIAVKKVSSFYKTAPYGGAAQNEFLNCAAEIETLLSPRALLNEIHRIEEAGERVRDVRWGDRTLDIDIVFFGKEIIAEDDLVVPHPDWFNRAFVVEPLKEIAPEFLCPLKNVKLKDVKIAKNS